MNKIISAYINLLLMITIAIVLIFHWFSMSKDKTEIDYLEDALFEVRRRVPKDSIISFQTSHTNGKHDKLYYQSQFVLSPRILTKSRKNIQYYLTIERTNISINQKKKYLIPSGKTILSFNKNNYFIRLTGTN